MSDHDHLPPMTATQSLAALVRVLFGMGRWRVIGTLALMIGASLSSALSIVLLIPLLEAVAVGGVDQAPRSSPVFAAVRALLGPSPSLSVAVLALCGATVVQGLLGWWQMLSIDTLKQEIKIRLRRRLFDDVLQMDWARFVRLRSSDLLETLISQVDRAEVAAHHCLVLTASIVTTACYIALACGVSWPLTSVVVASGALLFWLMTGLRRRAAQIGHGFAEADRALYHTLTEALASLKLIRSYGAEPHHLQAIDRSSRLWRTAQRRATDTEASLVIVLNLSTVVIAGAVTMVALKLLALPAATVFVLLALFMRLTPQVSQVQTHYHNLLVQLPAVGAVMRLRDVVATDAPAVAPQPPLVFARTLVLRDVTFAYDSAPVLDGVTLTVRAGDTIAVVGSSGAGKSTLVDLALGLLFAESGAVLVDDVPLTEGNAASWRSQVAYVPQDEFLFHDTIRANLQWAVPQASAGDIEAALRLASAGFVFDLPDGMDTIVGDRGVRLSGGERQRIALARALLRKPKLLVLDEATSALDSVHERAIQRAIDALHGTMAIVVVAHRLSTVRAADTIYVLEQGRVVESGSWDALVGTPHGRFRALADAQAHGVAPS